MQFSEIRADVRVGIGNPTVADVADAQINKCINKAYRYICTVYPMLQARTLSTITTVAGTQNYNLPTDSFAIRKLWDTTNNCWIQRRGDRFAAQQNYSTASQGRPLYYVPYSGQVQLWPIPDGVYVLDLYYQSTITDLSIDTDVPILPLPWHEGLIIKTQYVYYSWIRKDYAKAQAEDTSWKMWVAEMPTPLELESVDIDQGVEIPSLSARTTRGYDFDHGP